MDTNREVVIFENSQLARQKGGQAAQQNKQQKDQKDKSLNENIAENKKQGIAEGAKEAAKQQEQTKEQRPDVLKKSGEQDAIKEVAKEETKAKTTSDETVKELGKQEGIKEVAKESVKGQQAAQGKLDSLIEKIQSPLLKLYTSGYLFLNLAPDILTIDPLKVSVRYRSILKDEQVRSVFVKDIADVFVESIPFAAALRIVDSNDKENPILVKPFKKMDAEKAKSIIIGLIAANKENIDLSSIEVNENTAKKFEELGKTAPTE